MRRSELTANFQSNIKLVWNTVTNNKDWKWRSDLDHIDVLDDETFVEYTPDGYSTKFIITTKQEYDQYAFRMENKMFTGNWTGRFYETEDGGTKIVFSETLSIKNPVIELLSYFMMNLKKIQNQYILDLSKKLGEKL